MQQSIMKLYRPWIPSNFPTATTQVKNASIQNTVNYTDFTIKLLIIVAYKTHSIIVTLLRLMFIHDSALRNSTLVAKPMEYNQSLIMH